MTAMRDYNIEYGGLELGEHNFEFKITKEFFQLFEYDDILDAAVELHLKMLKDQGLLVFDFEFQGSLSLLCDRCADLFQQKIDNKQQLIVKTNGEEDDNDEIVCLAEEEYQFNIEQPIYDYILLALPIRRIHPSEADCNQDVIAKFEEQEEQQEMDPRWEALKALKK